MTGRNQIEPRQKVLINAAGGGAGSFDIQLAKHFGANVSGVDSSEKFKTMLSLGVDQEIDYAEEYYTKNGLQYDLILDSVASHSIFAYRRSLGPKGTYIMAGGGLMHLFQTLLIGSLLSIFSKKNMRLLAAKPNKHMPEILELIKSGKVKAVIDKQWHLEDTAEAFRYLDKGQSKGKVGIKIS